MTFTLPNTARENITNVVRNLGYKPIGYTEKGELNCVRPMGADYPRFHLYITESPASIRYSLHLDQKRPSYQGATAHSGDYDSDIVHNEAQRIKSLLASAKTASAKPFFMP